MTLPPNYFEKKLEQNLIRGRILDALPVGVSYQNLIIVLLELLNRFVTEEFKEGEEHGQRNREFPPVQWE